MINLSTNVVAAVTHSSAARDTNGTGLMPIQVALDAGVTATYTIQGRVSPDAPWVDLTDAKTAGLLEALSYCPFVRLNVTALSGTGSVRLWLHEE